jgi:hypothetical protein
MAGRAKPDRATRPRRRVVTWAKRITLTLLALIVVAIGGALVFIHTSWARNWARDEIVAALRKDFPGSSIRSISGSPFGTIELSGFVLGGRDGRPLATIDKLELEVSLSQLVYKSVLADKVRVRGVHVFAREQPPKPASPPPAVPAAGSEPLGWTITLPDVVVEGAQISVEAEDGTEVLDNVSLDAGVWIRADESISAVANVRGTWRKEPVSAAATLAIAGDVISVPVLSARLGGARLDLFGVTANFANADAPIISGVVAGRVPAALPRKLAEIDLPGDIALGADGRPTRDATEKPSQI